MFFAIPTLVALDFIINLINAFLITLLRQQHAQRFPGLAWCVAGLWLHVAGVGLLLIGGAAPPLVAVAIASGCVLAGYLFILVGLTHLAGKPGPQVHNFALLAAYLAAAAYFTAVQPNATALALAAAALLAVIAGQGCWLFFHDISPALRRTMLPLGWVFAAYAAVAAAQVLLLILAAVTGLAPLNVELASGVFAALYLVLSNVLAISLVFVINARLAAQAQTQAERYDKLFGSAPYAVVLSRLADARIVDVNQAFVTMTGFSRQEAIGSAGAALQFWANPDDRTAVLAELMEQGRLALRTVRFRRKDGALFTGLISAEQLRIDDSPHVLASISDITQHKQAEDALRQSESTLQVLINATADSLLLLAPDGTIVLGNEAVARRFNTTAANLPGRDAFDLPPYDLAESRRQQVESVFASGQPAHFADERWGRWMESSIYPVCDAQGRVIQVAVFGRDITEHRRLQETLAQARDAAEAASRAKSQFLANMSHELRTPLNAILGFSELLSRDPRLHPNQVETLAIINRSGEHLLTLINDVLDMAKIEAGRATLQEQDFDLHQLVADLVEMLSLRAAAKGLALRVVRDPAVPRFVHADEGKLRQILINLLGNAVKFTAAGHVELTVRQEAGPAPELRRLLIAVDDTGAGIAPEDAAAIFEPFIQTDGGRAAPEGTGLGLAISRAYARLMGGELTMTSVPGQGSCFLLEAPVRVVQVEPAGAQAAARPRLLGLAAGQPERRLLVVEDDADSRKLLADLLAGLGFAVRTAADGLEAFQTWAEWQPHLIWMDLRLPGLDGWEATRRIKAAAGERAPVIVALSAGVLNEERAAVLAAGCDDFLAKPFREAEIVDCLNRHLGVRMAYADSVPTSAMPPLAPLPPAVDLASLSPAWIEQVRQAAIVADPPQLRRLAVAVAHEQPELAAALNACTDAYDYGAILAALGDCT
jgi:PAS domain S-box-containing protein